MDSRSILFIARAGLVHGVFPELKQAGFRVSVAESLSGALKELSRGAPELVMAEPRLPGFSAEELLDQLNRQTGGPSVIILAEQGTADEAKRFMELGARDYWLVPVTWEKIRTQLEPGPDRGQTPTRDRPSRDREIIGQHSAMRRVLSLAKQVAPSTATVLISGGSGTGKELFARYIHKQSNRRDKPFIAINCAALPEHLLESELFGHEKGAFTGATHRKPGKFELASSGTLLLDEISEMDLALQAKLLRAIQEGEVDRVGGTESVRVDVRIICTTNRDLQEAVDQGSFRQDLFYRLNVIPLKLPSLQERPEDIPVLAEHFIESFCRQYGVAGLELSQQARRWLMEHDWPGNVRELQNLMERAVLLAGHGPIDTAHFLMDTEAMDWQEPEEEAPESTSGPAEETLGNEPGPDFEPAGGMPGSLGTLADMEKQMIMKSLENTSGNRTQAAKLLGISVRTLRNKLNEYRKQGDPI